MPKRALIVDDDRDTCELIERVLNRSGIQSLVVTNSADAAALLRQRGFAIVFLDLQMPFPDGLELTRLTRDSSYNRMTPLVLISDDPRPNAMTQGFDAGASFFLYKPLDQDRLLRLVRATQGAIDHERRRTRRVPIRSRVRLRIGGQDIEGETVDVSMEGLLVKAQRTIPVGSSVDVCLQLSSESKPVTTVGCVVRLSGANQMGVHLGRLTPAESQRLQEFLLAMVPVEA
jgi:DNA-binding response OmpR family regulator